MAGSEAEIDLIVNATNTLPEIQRDLDRIVRVAENGADDIDLDVALSTQDALRSVAADLDRVVAAASAGADDIDIDAVLDQTATVARLQEDLADVIARAQAGADQDPVRIDGVLNGAATLADVRDDLDRVVAAAQAAADDIDIDVDVDTDDARRSLRRFLPELDGVTRTATRAGGALGSLGVSVAGAGAAAGTAVPLLAALVTSVESLLPASAVAVQGMLAMQLVSGTLKLGMMGLEDAIEAAFDPDADPAALAEALEKLAPSARDFVLELQSMKDEFKDIQLDVQNRLFQGFDESLRDLSRSALPQVAAALGETADVLNEMGRGAAAAAVELAENGTLGTALDGATKGLQNFADVPAQATTALGQLAAAAAPAFDRITQAAARMATDVSERLTSAFESGALEDAINDAIDVLKQLGDIAGNVFGILRNVLGAAGEQGEGLFGTLEKITQALEDVTGTEQFQSAIGELVATMQTLATNVGPLFTSALLTISEVIEILAPVARELIDTLGGSLKEVLDAAREPLKSIANAFGELILALEPFIELAGELIAATLPSLTPLFDTLAGIIEELAPVIEQLALNIGASLLPILERLPEVLEIILPPFKELAETVFPLLAEILKELQPSLEEMATAIGELWVELAPLIAEFLRLAVAVAEELLPVLGPIFLATVGAVASVLTFLADVIGGIIMPILRGFKDLMDGDVMGALTHFGEAAGNTKELVKEAFVNMVAGVTDLLNRFVDTVGKKAAEAGLDLLRGIRDGIADTVAAAAGLPSKILGALGDLNGLLVNAGRAVIRGLISGITSQIGSLISTLSNITDVIAENKGPIERDRKLLTKNGQIIMDSLLVGFESRIPDIKATLGGITDIIPQSVAISGGNMAAPAVYVSIGNEAVDQYVTVRTTQVVDDRERELAQGVRR